MREIKECKLFPRCKAMLILTQHQDLIPQVQLLASVVSLFFVGRPVLQPFFARPVLGLVQRYLCLFCPSGILLFNIAGSSPAGSFQKKKLLASVQTFEIMVLRTLCTENDSPCSKDPSVAFGFGEELQDQ